MSTFAQSLRSSPRPARSRMMTSSSSEKAGVTVLRVPSSRDAARRSRRANISRSIYEEAHDAARWPRVRLSSSRAATASALRCCSLNQILRRGRLRLRGPRGALFEFRQPSLRTCAASPSCKRDRRLRSPPVFRERQVSRRTPVRPAFLPLAAVAAAAVALW